MQGTCPVERYIPPAFARSVDENTATLPVISCVAPASAGYAVPASAVEYTAPVFSESAALVSTMCATTAPMAEFIATLPASAVIAASAVVVEYVAVAPSLPSWWQLRSCTQQSRQAAQVHMEESIFRRVPRSSAQCQRQWRSRALGPNSSITAVVEQQKRCGVPLYCAASSKDVAAPLFLTAVTAAEALR